MRVILIKDVSGIGRAGDIKEVSDGYARNFLIPKRLATVAQTSQIEKITKEKREKLEKLDRELKRLEQSKSLLEAKRYEVRAKADGAKLFAAIHEDAIALEVSKRSGMDIEPARVLLDRPIKEVGDHKISIKLSDKLKATIKLTIVAL